MINDMINQVEVKERRENVKWALVKRSTQPTNKTSEPSPSSMEGEPPTNSPTPPQPRYPRIMIVFVLFWIIFGILFYVFVDLNQGSQTSPNGYVNEINNKILYELECKLEFENVNCEFDFDFSFYDYGLCNGLLCPTPYPTPATSPRPPIVEFNYSRVLLREQLVFKYVFGNENDIVSNMVIDINNGSFYDNGYYPTPYPTPFPTPTTALKFNGINVLKGVFGIGLCDNNETCNGMFDFLFFFKISFFRSSR